MLSQLAIGIRSFAMSAFALDMSGNRSVEEVRILVDFVCPTERHRSLDVPAHIDMFGWVCDSTGAFKGQTKMPTSPETELLPVSSCAISSVGITKVVMADWDDLVSISSTVPATRGVVAAQRSWLDDQQVSMTDEVRRPVAFYVCQNFDARRGLMRRQRIEGGEVILSPRKRGVKKFTMKSSLDDIDTVEPLRWALRQLMQCSILEYLAASRPAHDELQMITRKSRVPLGEDVQMTPKPKAPTVAVSGVGAKAERAATVYLDGMEGVPPDKFYILGSGTVETILNDERVLQGVIDNGSEAVIIDEELAVRLGLNLDKSYLFEIERADERKQKNSGVCHKAAIEVEGLRVLMPIFTVRDSELLLGRTWLSHVHAVTIERLIGSQMLSIKRQDNGRIMIGTVEPRDPRNRAALAADDIRKQATLASRSLRFREKKYGTSLTEKEGRILEVEDLGDRALVDGNSYLKAEDEEFGGMIAVSFLRA
ncbi:hypothetical protein CBR_g39907 [Chara braunii]|uniref:Uncharacterized protein n=1 Tax=Chara braunii TaxID=69332 RepID=A0A388K1G7_CHABU|nr:hypothetical protein CBR_g39907 [Chara braunii]|eukprot:GBG63902.1 hypothetical protein CBR_g39907 [Chara braunii]